MRFFTFYVSNISALLVALESAVQDARNNRVVPADVAHERIRTMYTWQNVARRTQLVSHTLHALLSVFNHLLTFVQVSILFHCFTGKFTKL